MEASGEKRTLFSVSKQSVCFRACRLSAEGHNRARRVGSHHSSMPIPTCLWSCRHRRTRTGPVRWLHCGTQRRLLPHARRASGRDSSGGSRPFALVPSMLIPLASPCRLPRPGGRSLSVGSSLVDIVTPETARIRCHLLPHHGCWLVGNRRTTSRGRSNISLDLRLGSGRSSCGPL